MAECDDKHLSKTISRYGRGSTAMNWITGKRSRRGAQPLVQMFVDRMAFGANIIETPDDSFRLGPTRADNCYRRRPRPVIPPTGGWMTNRRAAPLPSTTRTPPYPNPNPKSRRRVGR